VDAAASRRELTRTGSAAPRLHAALATALPLITIFLVLCVVYGWQAWRNISPWVVPDEFARAQLSRAIASTGHAAQRTVQQPFPTLYAYLIAPVWWIRDTAHAYAAAKAIGVVSMTSVVFPAYLLARMLASRSWALFVAAGTAMIPALAYSPLLMLEPVAYTWAALCFYLLTRALVTPRPRWLIAAAAACLLAPRIRGELGVIAAGAAGAVCAFWFTGAGGRRVRRSWTAWHWVGFALLVVGAVAAADVVAAHESGVWRFSTEQHASDMLRYGLRALGALTIGFGVLPTVAGLSALVKERGHAPSREQRAFMCTVVPMIVGFGLYTASKATFIAPTGQPFLLERNIIYVAPLLFAGTALVFDRRRAPAAAVVAATAFALYLVTATPYRLKEKFSFEAPGLSVLQSLHRDIGLTTHAATALLITVAVVSGCVVAFSPRVRGAPLFAAAVAVFVLTWSAYGEATYSRASHAWMRSLVANLPQPLDWVDRAVPHGTQVYYLGQSITDPSDLLELEFWNRSLMHVWSTDGTAPGPGPTVTPSVVSRDGRLQPGKDVRYLIADSGISPVGRVIARKIHLGGGLAPKPWTLVQVAQPLRLRQSVEGLYGNGWGAPRTALNTYSIPNDEPSVLRIDVSRHGLDPQRPATVRVRVGKLTLGVADRRSGNERVVKAVMGKVLFTRTLHVQHNLDHVFVFKAPQPPFRVETSVTPLAPHDIDPTGSRARTLGAYISYLVFPKRGG
jgi:hypothetical protein